jgi:tetratricopeptide (TPR) repeat protein
MPSRARLVLAAFLLGAAAAPAALRADDTASPLDGLEDRALRDEGRARYDEALGEFQEAFGTAVKEAASSSEPAKAARLRARAETYLEKIDDLAGRTQAHRRADAFLKGFSEDDLGPPLKGWVDWQRVRYLRQAGDLDASAALLRSLGLVTRWWVVGPFDNERGRGFGAKSGPETEEGIVLDLAATYPGKERPVSWRAVPAVHPYGWIDLEAMLRPNDQALAYAATWIRCEEPREVSLRFASDESIAAWVNGSEVLRREVIRRGGFDQDIVGVALRKGWNRVVVKVGTVTERSATWGFRMRATLPDGRPLADVAVPGSDEEVQAAAADPGTKAPAQKVAASRGALDALEPAAPRGKTAKEGSEDARAYFYLGVLHRARQYDDQKADQTDRKYFERAAELRPEDAVYRFHAAEAASRPIEMSVEKEENQQRRGREKAVDLDPEYAEAYAALAGYYTYSLPNLPRAEELARKALSINDGFLEAHLLLADVLRRRGFATEAAVYVERLLARPEFKGRTQYLRALADQGDRNGMMDAAADACRRALDADAEDEAARGRLAQVLMREALAEDAVGVFDERVRRNPFDLDAHRRKAHFLEGLERFADAAAAAAAGLAVAPEDEFLLDLQGRVLHRLGRRDDAVARWKEALRVNPKNAVLKRYVEWLDPSLKPFEIPYVEDAGSLLAAVKGREESNPDNDPCLVVLDKAVVRVNPDGTTSTFTHRIVKVLNNLGVKMNAYYGAAGFYRGEQAFEWRAARVWRRDGTVEPAQLQAGNPGVRWPQLQPGDAVEVQHRVDDLRQSFFGDYFGDSWSFADRFPVARSEWTLLVPESREIQIHARNMPEAATKPVEGRSEDGKFRTCTWSLRDVAKIRFEPEMPDPQERYPVVEVTTFKDWNQFATWWWALIKKQFIVDDGMRAKVEELTKGCATRLEKVRAIYGFVVTDIQYQAWEFGVHGYKPYTAAQIFNRRFGDCKDKAILIRTMLDQAGIEALPVLIEAAVGRSEQDMTLAQVGKFNHVIAYVPDADGQGHGMFLDGTAQYNSMDNVPRMDRGARVLVVRPDGAEVVQIPWNTPEQYSFGQEFDVALEPGGAADLSGRVRFMGDFSVLARDRFSVEGKRDLALQKLLGPTFGKHTVVEKTFPDLKDITSPEVEVGLRLRVDRLGEIEGDRMSVPVKFVVFPLFLQLAQVSALEKREHDLVLPNPVEFRVRATVRVPEGWKVSRLPEGRSVETPFARFRVSVKAEGGVVTYERDVALTANRVAREKYPEFRDLVAKVNASFTEKIVLERATAPDAPAAPAAPAGQGGK